MSTYSPVRQQFTVLSTTGETLPAASYRLFTYNAGTSTKVNTYSDFNCTVANTNPVVLDAYGSCAIFLQDGLFYKFVLAPPPQDVLFPDDPPTSNIWTQDNIPSTGLISVVATKTTNYTILAQTDRNKFFNGDTTSGSITFTLPSAVTVGNGFVFYIRKSVNDANTITLTPVGGQTIDLAASKTMASYGESIGYISDGSNWVSFARSTLVSPAPIDATYITQTPNGSLSNEQALSSLSSGVMYSTTATGVIGTRVITGTANEITLTNGDAQSGNPTISLPSALTFTGKTITGGTFTSPTINTPTLTVTDNVFTIQDNGDTTKKLQFEVSGVSAATTRTKTVQDNNGTLYETGGTDVALLDGGTNASLTASNGGIFYSTASAGAILAGTATANKMLLSGSSTTPSWSTSTIPTSSGATANKVLLSDGTNYVLSTPTFPNASATALKHIRSDGTNWIASTATISDTPSTAGKVLVSDGTNWITSTPTFPNSSATALKHIRSDGTNWIASTATISDTPGTAGKMLVSDGTNWITSTPTFPNASATAGKIIRSDGTNWLAGTSTFADTYTASNLLYSNGANTVTGLATANSSVLVTDGSGIPSLSTTLPNIALGTPTSLTLTNATGLPVAGGGTGLATTTAYGVIHAGTTATGAFQNSGTPGASGTVYKSAGPTALPTWVDPSTIGAWQKISTSTASSSASITFSSLSSTYRAYMILLQGVVPATNAVSLQLEHNADTTGGNYAWAAIQVNGKASPASTAFGAFGSTVPVLTGDATLANTSTRGVSGYVILTGPNTASNSPPSVMQWQISFNSSTASTFSLVNGAAYDGTATTLTSVTFLMSSGNISTGTFELYGVLA